VSYENPNINGTTPCGESKQVGVSKPRPVPTDASGPRKPGQGGL
jgi:hypothetical protein